MGVWIGFNGFVKGFVDKRVVIVFAQHIRHNTPVAEVQDSAQIELVCCSAIIPLEFRHIGQPFLVGLVRMELAVQEVFRDVLWILGLSGAAVAGVLDGGFDVPGPADAQHPLVIDMDAVVVPQIVIEPSVAFVWTFFMDPLNFISQTPVLLSSAAQLPRCPFVVGRPRHMEQSAGHFNGIPLFFITFFDCYISLALSYF